MAGLVLVYAVRSRGKVPFCAVGASHSLADLLIAQTRDKKADVMVEFNGRATGPIRFQVSVSIS